MFEVTTNAGTPIDELPPPQHPLAEKWGRLYPPTPMPQYSQVCDGYSCMWCGRCPFGDKWEVPEEDREVWEQYQKELQEYFKATGIL